MISFARVFPSQSSFRVFKSVDVHRQDEHARLRLPAHEEHWPFFCALQIYVKLRDGSLGLSSLRKLFQLVIMSIMLKLNSGFQYCTRSTSGVSGLSGQRNTAWLM